MIAGECQLMKVAGVVIVSYSFSMAWRQFHATNPTAARHCWTSQQWHPTKRSHSPHDSTSTDCSAFAAGRAFRLFRLFRRTGGVRASGRQRFTRRAAQGRNSLIASARDAHPPVLSTVFKEPTHASSCVSSAHGRGRAVGRRRAASGTGPISRQPVRTILELLRAGRQPLRRGGRHVSLPAAHTAVDLPNGRHLRPAGAAAISLSAHESLLHLPARRRPDAHHGPLWPSAQTVAVPAVGDVERGDAAYAAGQGPVDVLHAVRRAASSLMIVVPHEPRTPLMKLTSIVLAVSLLALAGQAMAQEVLPRLGWPILRPIVQPILRPSLWLVSAVGCLARLLL